MNILHKIIFIIIATSTIFVVVCGKVKSVGRKFMAHNEYGYSSGDLYNLCEIEKFKQKIVIKEHVNANTLEECDILTLGDSFFNTANESDFFANELEKRVGYKVYNIKVSENWEAIDPVYKPLAYLQSIHYTSKKRKILILETAERHCVNRAKSYNTVFTMKYNDKQGDNTYLKKLLDNKDVEYFFKNNIVVHPINKYVKNLRYKYFKIIDRSIGKYSENPKMLFYRPEIEFNNLANDERIDEEIVNSINKLSKTLENKFNIYLIFIIIPNKYSIYADYVESYSNYGEFIPRICKKLSKNNVCAIDLYSVYANHRKRNDTDLLYYPSDTHYTPLGKTILISECLKKIKQVKRLNN